MYSTIARRAMARVGQACRSISSPLTEAKNDSERALSQHWPVRPRDSVTPPSLARQAKAAEVYWGAAPVAVEDHAGRRVASGQSVGQRAGGQLSAQVIGEGVTDDAPGGDVDHRGQVQPSLPGTDVGDVAAPPGVDLAGVGGEVPADLVRPG